MSAISLKSITGITSITAPAGVDNQLTLHTNDTTQRVKVTESGVEIAGITTFSHTGANQLVIKDSDTSGSGSHMRISFQDSGGTEKFFVGNDNNNDYLYLGSGAGQPNPTVIRYANTDKLTVENSRIYVNTSLEVVGSITAADSIIHQNDTNTKIRFPAADTITAETSGNERFRIDSNGRIGLGIANPDAYFSSYNRVVMGRTNDTGGMTIVSASTSGGYISFADGTSGNQAYRGMIAYQHGGDYMTFGTDGGLERLRITSSGSVNIASSSTRLAQTTFKSQIETGTNKLISFGDAEGSQSDKGSAIIFSRPSNGAEKICAIFQHTNQSLGIAARDNFTVGTGGNSFYHAAIERLLIDSNGTTILKNTADATSRSDFLGSLRPISQIASTWNAYHSLTRHDAASSYGPYLMLAKNRNDVYNSNGIVQDNDELGNISFQGNDGAVFREGARIRGEVDGTPGSNQMPSALTFATNAGSGVVENVRIDSSGRLLVGTTNNTNGHVSASKAAVHGHLAIFKDSGGDNAGVNSHQIKFVTQSGSIAEIQATSEGAGGPSGRGGYLSLFAKPNNNATLKEMVRITSGTTTFLRQGTSSEGGEISFARASDNANYFWVDTFGSGSQPRFRLHGGDGGELASISSNGEWFIAPQGTIMNVGYARYDPNNDSYTSVGADTKARSSAYLDYACRRTDSKLIIMTRMHTRMIAALGCSYGIDYSTDSGSNWTTIDGMYQRNAMDFFFKGDGVNHHYTAFCTRQIDAYSGTRRFSPWGQGWGGGTWELSYGHGEHSVTIYEVAV